MFNQLFTRHSILLLILASLLIFAIPANAELRAKGSMAPDFTLNKLDGTAVTLSELRGKPVVIEFWASWCGPCRKQFPKMAEVHEKFDGQVHFLMVNMKESSERIQAFGQKIEIPGTILLDPDDGVGELYGTRILPTIFFIDASGKIQEAHAGTMRDIERFIAPMVK